MQRCTPAIQRSWDRLHHARRVTSEPRSRKPDPRIATVVDRCMCRKISYATRLSKVPGVVYAVAAFQAALYSLLTFSHGRGTFHRRRLGEAASSKAHLTAGPMIFHSVQPHDRQRALPGGSPISLNGALPCTPKTNASAWPRNIRAPRKSAGLQRATIVVRMVQLCTRLCSALAASREPARPCLTNTVVLDALANIINRAAGVEMLPLDLAYIHGFPGVSSPSPSSPRASRLQPHTTTAGRGNAILHLMTSARDDYTICVPTYGTARTP